MRLILLFSILFAAFQAHSQKKEQKRLLWESYNTQNTKMLEQFFENWHKESTPISNEEFKNLSDVEKDVYEIFMDFYTPLNLTRLSKHYSDTTYNNVRYVIIQNTLKYVIVKTLDKKSLILKYLDQYKSDTLNYKIQAASCLADTSYFNIDHKYFKFIEIINKGKIKNFSPDVHVSNKKNTYLYSFYKKLISTFLSKGEKNYITNPMKPDVSVVQWQLRLAWLNNYVKIFIGHWGGYWMIETAPTMIIYLNEKRDTALISYTITYEGGRALYHKINGKWTLIKSANTWLE